MLSNLLSFVQSIHTPGMFATSSSIMLKVLFVCVGNSCRSPMAESVLRNQTAHLQPAWLIDSAAIADWNVGRSPEPRALKVLADNGLSSEHTSRQITAQDFHTFDYIFGMDDYNMRDLADLAPADSRARLVLLGRYDYGRPEVIADPYFERGIRGFEEAFVQIERSCRNFVASQTQEVRESSGEL